MTISVSIAGLQGGGSTSPAATPTIVGTAAYPGGDVTTVTVHVLKDGNPAGTATPDAGGNWTFTFGTLLNAVYAITAYGSAVKTNTFGFTVNSPLAALPIIARYEADNPANTIRAALAQTFTSSDVDTGNNKLTLSGLFFPTKSGTRGHCTPIIYTTTGTPLAGLTNGASYWIENDLATGTGYSVWTNATLANQPGAVTGENILPAQNLSQRVNRVTLTSAAGTGTHMLTCARTGTVMADMSGKGYDCTAALGGSRHFEPEIFVGSDGLDYWHLPGKVERDNTIASYNEYGKYFGMRGVGVGQKLAGRAESQGARSAFVLWVGTPRLYTKNVVLKFTVLDTDINTATDVITNTAHGLASGNLLNISSFSNGATFPTAAGLTDGGDCYARAIDANTFTLHDTAAHAVANTNKIDITNAGSGTFSVAAPELIGDAERSEFWVEWLDPVTGGNTLTPSFQQVGAASTISLTASAFTVSGAGNGNIASLSAYTETAPVTIWIPPRAVGPTRQDTGLPLASGNYWLSKSGSSMRLHLTKADAIAAIGVATASTNCLKFTAAGVGTCRFKWNDGCVYVSFGAGSDNFNYRVPAEVQCVISMFIDWNPTVETNPVMKLAINGVLVETSTAVGLIKGLLSTPAVDASTPPWTPFNSAAYHVAGKYECNALILGVSTSLIDHNLVLAAHAPYMSKHGIS